MNDLETVRKKIDEIDREMARLFEARMEAVAAVARYKAKNDIAVSDPQREADMIARNTLLLQEGALRPYYVRFLQCEMDISKDYQRALIGE